MSINEGNIRRLVLVEKSISKERGDFTLFALMRRFDILRERNQEMWDLAVAATWLKSSPKLQENREYIFKKLLSQFSGEEIIGFIESLVVMDSEGKSVASITKMAGYLDHVVKNTYKDALEICKSFTVTAHVITSRPKDNKKSRKTKIN